MYWIRYWSTNRSYRDNRFDVFSYLGFLLLYPSITTKGMSKLPPIPKSATYTSVEICNLSPRTLNELINSGVGSVEQLEERRDNLSSIPLLSEKGIEEINDYMERSGRDLLGLPLTIVDKSRVALVIAESSLSKNLKNRAITHLFSSLV